MADEEITTEHEDEAGANDTPAESATPDLASENEKLRKEQGTLRRQASKAQNELEKAMKRLDELESAEDERKRAAMTETERAAEAAAEAKAEAARLSEELVRERINARRARLIADKAADLPAVFRERIVGDDDDAIFESIDAQREAYNELRQTVATGVLGASETELAALVGEEAAKAFFAGQAGKRPASPVSGPTAVGNQPRTEPSDPDNISGAPLSVWVNRATNAMKNRTGF